MQAWEVVDLDPEQIAYNEEQAKQRNKQQAETLLQQTDWTCTVDINNPEYSDPYLANQNEFLAYRSAVRKIAVNPPVTVTEWPVEPDEVWASV
jgi:REP element-mobilizing transposase RayT